MGGRNGFCDAQGLGFVMLVNTTIPHFLSPVNFLPHHYLIFVDSGRETTMVGTMGTLKLPMIWQGKEETIGISR